MVAPAVEAPVVIALDVGGTKILSGLVDREGNVLEEHEVPSPGESEEDVLAALDAAVEALLDDRVAAIGYGIPANLERGTGRILNAMNLPLDDVDLDHAVDGAVRSAHGHRERRERGDARRVAEGAGRGTRNLVMLTLGTGVGGGVVVDGRLFRGVGRARAHRRAGGGRSARAAGAAISRCWRRASMREIRRRGSCMAPGPTRTS